VNWLGMIRHTLATLGPKVQATRMVRDYVLQMYAPAAVAGRLLDGPDRTGARELAAWKATVRSQWPSVRVDHVESGVGEVPQVGDALHVRAHVSLGTLEPTDVEVQVVHGKVSESDELTTFGTQPLVLDETLGSGRYSFGADVLLAASGPFGYTVRIVPQHPGLGSIAELGLVVNAS
jgi:glycogen phosphorylase